MQNNRSRIVIIAIILATFAAGALVWYLAKPSTETPVDVAQEQPQDGIFVPQEQPESIPQPISSPIIEERQPAPQPQVAAAVNPSAESGTTEVVLALIALAAIGGAFGLYRFTTV